MAKPILVNREQSTEYRNTQLVLYKVLEKSLRVLYPFMPFITEEIWHNLEEIRNPKSESEAKRSLPAGEILNKSEITNSKLQTTIMAQTWPHIQKQMINKKIDSDMQILIDTITAIRNIRSAWNINPALKVDTLIKTKKDTKTLLDSNLMHIKNLARAESVTIGEDVKKPPKSAAAVVRDVEIYVPLEKLIDLKLEKERTAKKIDELSNIIKGIDAKLKNKEFLKKAPPEVVEKEKARKTELSDTLARLKSNLKELC